MWAIPFIKLGRLVLALKWFRDFKHLGNAPYELVQQRFRARVAQHQLENLHKVCVYGHFLPMDLLRLILEKQAFNCFNGEFALFREGPKLGHHLRRAFNTEVFYGIEERAGFLVPTEAFVFHELAAAAKVLALQNIVQIRFKLGVVQTDRVLAAPRFRRKTIVTVAAQPFQISRFMSFVNHCVSLPSSRQSCRVHGH